MECPTHKRRWCVLLYCAPVEQRNEREEPRIRHTNNDPIANHISLKEKLKNNRVS
jgi:hypothetical protein